MKSILIALVVSSLFMLENRKQTSDDDRILWSKSKNLTWDDFEGLPNEKSRFKANTNTTVGYSLIINTQELIEFEITACFNTKQSWTKSISQELLKHEQIHFDISELVMRKLRKFCIEYKFQTFDLLSKDIKEKYKLIIDEKRLLNQQYDKETNHGTIKKKQEEWEKKIQKELDELKEYSNTRVTIVKNKTISPAIKTNKN